MVIPERLKRPLRESRLTARPYRALARQVVGGQVALYQRFGARYFSAAFFDELYATRPDPWSFQDDPFSELRRDRLLAQLPGQSYERLLEVGCAEGWITPLLAVRARSVVALDISEVALARARSECAGCPNVRFVRGDLLREPLDGPFDAIVCAGVLPFCPRLELATVGDRLVDALVDGSDLLLENSIEPGAGELSDREIAASFRGRSDLHTIFRGEFGEYAITVMRRAPRAPS